MTTAAARGDPGQPEDGHLRVSYDNDISTTSATGAVAGSRRRAERISGPRSTRYDDSSPISKPSAAQLRHPDRMFTGHCHRMRRLRRICPMDCITFTDMARKRSLRGRLTPRHQSRQDLYIGNR